MSFEEYTTTCFCSNGNKGDKEKVNSEKKRVKMEVKQESIYEKNFSCSFVPSDASLNLRFSIVGLQHDFLCSWEWKILKFRGRCVGEIPEGAMEYL